MMDDRWLNLLSYTVAGNAVKEWLSAVVLSPDYNQYMDIQQAINLAIHEAFEAEGIEFAYPTQTLFLQR